MYDIEVIAPKIWAVAAPLRFLGMHVGTRMTIVQLSNGDVLVHSPVPLTRDLQDWIHDIGPLRHIVCPNDFHHLYAGQWVQAYPDAALYGSATLQAKRKDLKFDVELSDSVPADWEADLELLSIEGCLLRETVFYHRASRTLIASDLVENFKTSPHAPTRVYLRLQGLYGRVGWGRLVRFIYRDRRKARKCIDRLLEWPFEQVVVGHGDVLREQAHAQIRQGMAWL